MGLFDSFYKNTDTAREARMQKDAMNFNREQQIHQTTIPEDNTEYMERENRSDLIRWQQELDPELDNIAYRLTGWRREEGKWFRTEKVPLCNDNFMDSVVAPQLEPWLSKNLVNSYLSEERILRDLQSTANEIVDNMADNWENYGIDFTNYDLILRLLKNTMRNSAFRALNGWTKKVDATVIKRVESHHENEKEKEKKGLFN